MIAETCKIAISFRFCVKKIAVASQKMKHSQYRDKVYLLEGTEMIRWVDMVVQKCVKEEYITQEDAPWLHYAIEKKLSSILISIPFLTFGIFLSKPGVAVAFYTGFCFLRERTSGIHAKTIAGCFVLSLLFEYLFLGILFWRLRIGWIIFLAVISSVVIYLYAPYNHPNMGFSTKERRICSHKAKIRLLIIIVLSVLFFLLGQHTIASGLCLSIAMAAFLLVFAYITN